MFAQLVRHSTALRATTSARHLSAFEVRFNLSRAVSARLHGARLDRVNPDSRRKKRKKLQ